MASRESPVAWSVLSVAATMAPSEGWLVVPAIGPRAPSMASTPASMAARYVASWPPAVSWVCRWTGKSKLSLQSTDEDAGGGRPQQPGHVLYAQYVHSRLDELFGFAQVIIERVEPLGRAGQVARVADRPLGHLAGLEDRAMAGQHLVDVVQGIENPEYIDPGPGRLLDEGERHLVGVGVYPTVLRPLISICKQMLGTASLQCGEAFPGILFQKAQGHVEGRPAQASSDNSPGSMREKYGAPWSMSGVRSLVASNDWCASRSVVSVTATGTFARANGRNPRGRGRSSTWRLPSGTGPVRPRLCPCALAHSADVGGSFSLGSAHRGAGPLGRLTVTSAM